MSEYLTVEEIRERFGGMTVGVDMASGADDTVVTRAIAATMDEIWRRGSVKALVLPPGIDLRLLEARSFDWSGYLRVMERAKAQMLEARARGDVLARPKGRPSPRGKRWLSGPPVPLP